MKKQKGQGMVEFLIIIPYLLALVLMVIDGAYLMWVLVSIKNAVGEGGRVAQVWRPNAQEVTCLEDTLAAIDRVTTFAYTLELSDNCKLAGPYTRIPRMDPIVVTLVVDHTPFTSTIFFQTPPVIHLPAQIIVAHQ